MLQNKNCRLHTDDSLLYASIEIGLHMNGEGNEMKNKNDENVEKQHTKNVSMKSEKTRKKADEYGRNGKRNVDDSL